MLHNTANQKNNIVKSQTRKSISKVQDFATNLTRAHYLRLSDKRLVLLGRVLLVSVCVIAMPIATALLAGVAYGEYRLLNLSSTILELFPLTMIFMGISIFALPFALGCAYGGLGNSIIWAVNARSHADALHIEIPTKPDEQQILLQRLADLQDLCNSLPSKSERREFIREAHNVLTSKFIENTGSGVNLRIYKKSTTSSQLTVSVEVEGGSEAPLLVRSQQ